MKRILAATDGSEGSDRAVDFAAGLAKAAGAELLIVNVIGGYGLPGGVLVLFSEPHAAWLEELLTAHSAEVLVRARERASKAGLAGIQIEGARGDVASTLADLAKQRAADAIVVGKHGAGGAEALLLGGVAHKLVSLAGRPVIVVP